LGLVNRAVLAKCDSLDGVSDGILENPLACKFDPVEIRCNGKSSDDCLTDIEVSAFQKIYGGPRLRNGKQISHGPAIGSEEGPAGWAGWVVPDKTAWFGQEFYRWLAFDDPDWKVEAFDIDRDYPRALERIAPIVNANDPDLRAFAKRGGRLIMYQGWYDAGITPGETIGYYDEVRRHLGSATNDHVRLFMVPGMAHCADGPGAGSFDMLPTLDKWVEHAEAPDRIIASKSDNAGFTHPLCPWPKTARYNGFGPTNDAASFKCK
jgi:feruloyl esterase